MVVVVEGEAVSVSSGSCFVGFDVVSEEVEVGESGSKDLKESLSEDG